MAETAAFEPGGYRYVRGTVSSTPGASRRSGDMSSNGPGSPGPCRLTMDSVGLRRISTRSDDRSLRSVPANCARQASFSEEGFVAFNRLYVRTLERWGIFKDEENPVARSNVCPEVDPPAAPCFHAFSYTMPAGGERPGRGEELCHLGLRRSTRRARRGMRTGSSASGTPRPMRCEKRRNMSSARWSFAWRRSA